MTNVEKSKVYECADCGWREIEDEVPKANDPWTTDGGALMYCPNCGSVDNMVELKVWSDVQLAVMEENERCAKLAEIVGNIPLANTIRWHWEGK